MALVADELERSQRRRCAEMIGRWRSRSCADGDEVVAMVSRSSAKRDRFVAVVARSAAEGGCGQPRSGWNAVSLDSQTGTIMLCRVPRSR